MQSDLSRRAFLTTLTLALSSLLFMGMLVARMAYTGEPRYRFFIWNLFLAWVPFACAFFAYRLHRYAERSSIGRRLFTALFLLAWLVFFPNAPYVATDFIHWQQGLDVLAFYDLVMILLYVITGLVLGALSLYLAHAIVEDALGPVMGWLFVLGISAAGGLGIYIGRFLRWNSWDLALNPDDVLRDVLSRFMHPIANARSILFVLMMTAFVFCVYVLVKSLAGMKLVTREL